MTFFAPSHTGTVGWPDGFFRGSSGFEVVPGAAKPERAE